MDGSERLLEGWEVWLPSIPWGPPGPAGGEGGQTDGSVMSGANRNASPWNLSALAILLTPLGNKSCFFFVIIISDCTCIFAVMLRFQRIPFDSSGMLGSMFGPFRVQHYYRLIAYLLPPQAENRHANDLPSSSVYCLPFFVGIKGDRFTKYIVQSYYGV